MFASGVRGGYRALEGFRDEPRLDPVTRFGHVNGVGDKWRHPPFILWIEGWLLMTSGVHVLDVSWRQEENKQTVTALKTEP